MDMICLMIVFGILYVICFLWNVLTDDGDGRNLSVWLLTISAVVFVEAFTTYASRDTPTAKDVYEGKTTLEIKYRDSVPIDTIIVFKDEFKKSTELW